MMLSKFRKRLTHSNHEIVKTNFNTVINVAKNLIKFFKYEHKEEDELHLYNEPEFNLMDEDIEEEKQEYANIIFVNEKEEEELKNVQRVK
jgi:hypothetical protein